MHAKLKLAAEAYRLLAQIDELSDDGESLRSKAIELLVACPGAEALADQPHARALIGASWVRCGRPQLAAPYLDFDWTSVTPEAAGIAGSALLNLGAIGPALVALKAPAEMATAQPAFVINFGRALLISGHEEEALSILERGRDSLRDQPLALLSVAEALLALNRIDEALAQLPENSKDEQVIAGRVQLLGAANRHAEAASFLHEARTAYPDSVPLLLLSAELAEIMGRSGLAAAMLNKALNKDPENIALWARLAHTGRKGMAGPLAREAADKAVILAQGKDASLRALALNAHAHVMAEEGRSAEAVAAYREVLELAPLFVPALSGLGHLLLQNGKIDEAMQCFQQVRAIAPLHGWSQLIQAREVPSDPEILEDMERAARQPGLEGPVRSGLLYTVAAAWDRLKNYDRAMTIAHEANQASIKLLGYNPASHRRRIEREIGRFSADFMKSRLGWGNPSRLPVFVLGMPRSGTTLTEQILASHRKIFGAGELGLVGEQVARLDAWEQHIGSGLHYPDCVLDLSKDRSARLADDWLAQLRAFDNDALHVIDKLPHNFEHIGLIKLLFPNAIIFHCKREPRDIAVSNYVTDYAAKFGGMGFAYDLGWIGEQLVDHDRIMAHWQSVFPDQIMEVVYEDLVEDTESWARRMIAFMGLDWEPGVLDFQDLDRPVKTASAWQVRQPVYKTSKARWKRYAAHLAELEKALAHVPPMPAALEIPDMPPGLFTQGVALLKQGRAQDAEKCFLKVLEIQAGHAAAHHFLGCALLEQDKAKEAVQSMRRSVNILPVHASWFENLARAEYAAQNPKAAEGAYLRAHELRASQNAGADCR